MAKRSEFVEHIIEALRPLGSVTARSMFGGYGVYRSRIMIGLVADDVLYLKVDGDNRGGFEAAGCRPFTYQHKSRKKPVQMSYWEVPRDVLEESDVLCDWAREAHAAAVRSRRAKSPRRQRG